MKNSRTTLTKEQEHKLSTCQFSRYSNMKRIHNHSSIGSTVEVMSVGWKVTGTVIGVFTPAEYIGTLDEQIILYIDHSQTPVNYGCDLFTSTTEHIRKHTKKTIGELWKGKINKEQALSIVNPEYSIL